MRLCIISSDINKLMFDKKRLAELSGSLSMPEPIDEIYITGYEWPGKAQSSAKAYPLKSRSKSNVRAASLVLKKIDRHSWLPAVMAIPAVWIMQNEFYDTIAGFDPDIIVLTGIRWQKELKYLLGKYFGDSMHFSGENSTGMEFQIRRNYHPSVKVSIVLPTYNGSRYIKESIDSCLNQTHRNIELIIVDDASTDNTPDIVKSYDDKRIVYIRHERNLKLPQALNAGFTHAAGDYLTWTSDDNFYSRDAIKLMLSFLCTYRKIDFVYAGQYAINENGKIFRCDEVRPVESLKISNPVGGCFLYPRRVAERIGKYNPDAFLAEDLDYWIRVDGRFHMAGMRRLLYYYRYHKDSLTSKNVSGMVSRIADTVRRNHNVISIE